MQVSPLNPARPQGFTLLEIMLVLALMGLVLATVVPSLMSGTDSAQRETSAKEFINQAIQVRQQAMSEAQDRAISLTKTGYTFLQRDQAGDWVQLEEPVKLPDGISIRHTAKDSPWQEMIDADAQLAVPIFDSTRELLLGGSEDTALLESDEDKKVFTPNIFLSAAGDNTPATLTFSTDGDKNGVTSVRIDEAGNIVIDEKEAP